MFGEIRPNRGSQTYASYFHMTSRKQTVQGKCTMNEQQPNSLRNEDHSE